jgi:glycosyltransferase involved in cell wall biosynthesis
MDFADRPTRLLLAIPHLGGGGAERVIALLARHLDPALFEIHMAVLAPDGPGAPALPSHVIVHRLNCLRVRNALFPLLKLIWSIKPRLVLSGMAHLNFLIILLEPFLPHSTRILLRQNTTASAAAQGRLTRLAYRCLYPRAHRILCQSTAMADDLVTHFGLAREKLSVLHNPVETAERKDTLSGQHAHSANGQTAPNLLYVGRLSHEKGTDLLLHAFAKLHPYQSHATLTILGTGPEEATLRHLSQSLGIDAQVRFEGHANPAEYFRTASLFVLSSRYEGVPNALLEAAAAGLPIVATPASAGIGALLRKAPGCWLASEITVPALAEALHQALAALPQLPLRLTHRFLEPFRLEPAIAAYTELLLAESRPTLAFLIPTLDQIGGAERQVLELAHEFHQRSWSVTLLTLSGSGAALRSNPEFSALRHLSLGMRKAWVDPRGWLRYLGWHRTSSPEILHAHLPHATFFARISRILAPVPVLIDTIHTTATGPPLRRLAYRLTHPLSSRLTCVSRAVQDVVCKAGMAPDPIVIPNGVRLPEVQTKAVEEPEIQACFRWLAIGRLAPVKDYPTLFRAFAQLPSYATLTIAGSGPEERSLQALAHELGIASRIHCLGFQPDVQPLFLAADAFVQSSLWEGLPIAILEASAAGLPVIATDGPGTSETLIPGQTGLLAPVCDSNALAAAMLQLMQMPAAKRRRIGINGRAFVESNFALPAVIGQWEQLYRELLHGTASRSEPASLPGSSKPETLQN